MNPDDLPILVGDPPPPIPSELAHRIARVALLIAQEDNRRNKRGLDSLNMIPWEDRTTAQRSALAAGATRVVQALMALQLIEGNDAPARIVLPS